MSAIQVSDGYLQSILNLFLNSGTPPTGFTFHLYTNNITPTPASVLADFTECSIAGYASQAVTSSGWSINASAPGQYKGTNTTVSFTMTSSGTVYGLYVTDGVGALVWSEKFDTPLVFGDLGGTVTIEPTLESKSPLA